MADVFFTTGASGTLGKRLVRLLLEQTDSELVLLVHDRGACESVSHFLHETIGCVVPDTYGARVQLIPGDITKPHLGIDTVTYNKLTSRVTHVVHCAATTRFNLSLEDARLINVIGTEHVLSLFEQCDAPVHFGFLSTAYVAGKQTGHILEAPLTNTSGFVNTYEQTKWEAEELVSKMSGSASIYRLSTVIGDSRNGHVDHFTAPHQALRIMYLGLAAMVPGDSGYSVDLIPSDHASQALVSLLLDPTTYGHIFHVTAGKDRSYTLAELLEASYELLAANDPEWARKGYPKTPIVSQTAFDLFLKSADAAQNTVVAGVLGAMKHFAHQLSYPKEFDRTNIDKSLPEYHATMPHVRAYYPAVVKYCVSTKFGRI